MPTSIKGWLLLTSAAMIGLLIFATAYQYWLERRARSWLTTHGRIRSSKIISRKVRKVGEKGHEVRNFAEVIYDYDIEGEDKPRRGSKVSIGQDTGNFEVTETVARYPEGAPVIVHFDPVNPAEAVLEREAPEGIYRTLVIFILCCMGLWLAFAFGTEPIVEAIAARIPKPGNMWAVGLFGGIGLFIALLAAALSKELRATENWKATWGRIERAEVHKFKASPVGKWERRWSWFYYPLIAYSYTVGGQRYGGSRILFGGRMFASLDFWARRQAAGYKPGAPIEVFYDPKDPTQAVLKRRSLGLGGLWLVAIVLLGLAARAAGFF